MVDAAPPRPPLSAEARTALTAATKELHRLAWDIAQVAIDLDDCETLAANVLVAYFSAIAADEDAVYYTDHTRRHAVRFVSVPRCQTCGSANVDVGGGGR